MKFGHLIHLPLMLSGCLLVGFPGRAQNISGVVNNYYKVTAINTATSTLTLSSAAGLVPGTRVVIMQMKGATIDVTNTSTFGNINAINNAGNYEVNSICSVVGNDVVLKFSLLRTYTTTGLVQLISMPRYTAAVVTSTVSATPWDSVAGTGGVVAIECIRSLTLQASIDASGAGFRGATYLDFPIPPNDCNFLNNITDYVMPNPTANTFSNGGRKGEGIAAGNSSIELGRGKLANGGGGGNNHNSGGAGGSNYGAGGTGGQRSNEGAGSCHGQYPGIGGLGLQTNGYANASNRIFLGGGGGSGHGNNDVGENGGHGGGIIIILADTVYGNNNMITANGAQPYRAVLADPLVAGGDGGGGGGGGGVVILDVNNYAGNLTVQANGGRGSDASMAPSSGCFGPGGGGGGGVIWVKGASVNPGITASVTGGGNGVISSSCGVTACRGLANGAAIGTNGAVIANYSRSAASVVTCIPLPAPEILYFKSRQQNGGTELMWKLRDQQNDILRFELERSADQTTYRVIESLNNAGRIEYSYTDPSRLSGFIYYRLKLMHYDGRVTYSNIVTVEWQINEVFQLLQLSPNPARNVAHALVQTDRNLRVVIAIYDATGQLVIQKHEQLQKGVTRLGIDLTSLQSGPYFIRFGCGETNIVQMVMLNR